MARMQGAQSSCRRLPLSSRDHIRTRGNGTMKRQTTLPLIVMGLCLALLLAACSNGPRKRVFAPNASVQELVLQTDGSWLIQLRIQSFSNVPHTVSNVSARLLVDGIEAGSMQLVPPVAIGPFNAEVEELQLQPSSEAAARVSAALDERRSVRYELRGTLESSEPDKRRDDFTFEGQLWPVPGLSGVMR